MSPAAGRIRTRAALARLLPSAHSAAPMAAADLFGRELDEYAEVIVGPGRRPAGFMTRGEDASFTERAQAILTQLGMPAEALAHHRLLAEWFEHVRAFLKLEWHVSDSGVAPLAACYFRRRPLVDEVLSRLVRFGAPAAARERVMDVARLLDKESVHFVSAAFRPGQPVHHKLYFSQWLTPETRDKVAERLARVFALYDFPKDVTERWRKNHERMIHGDDSTLFVSLSFTAQGLSPSLKIDYPAVAPARAAVWLPEAEQLTIIDEAAAACALVASEAVSFLGVRFTPGQAVPALKYYCDVPQPPPV